MIERTRPLDVVVLAGERGDGAALAAAAGVTRKVLAPIGGVPVIERVLTALDATQRFGARFLCGPDRAVFDATPGLASREAGEESEARRRESEARTETESQERNGNGRQARGWTWLPPESSPAKSAAAALARIDNGHAVLLTTADHALLTAEIVHDFCDRSFATDADLTVGFVRYDDVMKAFPGSRRTGWKFADGRYCSCNLFGFMTPQARRVADFWQRAEALRKRPWRIVAILGVGLLVRYAIGTLTFDGALGALSRATQSRIRAVLLPFPQAAVDLDTLEDWELVKKLPVSKG